MSVDLWDFIVWGAALLIAFIGFVVGVVKWSFMQHERSDRERFNTQETTHRERYDAQEIARREAAKQWLGKFEDIDRRLDSHAERVTRMEATAAKSPTHEDLAQLHQRIDAVAGAIKGLQGEFKGASHTLQLIHSYLLNGDKG